MLYTLQYCYTLYSIVIHSTVLFYTLQYFVSGIYLEKFMFIRDLSLELDIKMANFHLTDLFFQFQEKLIFSGLDEKVGMSRAG